MQIIKCPILPKPEIINIINDLKNKGYRIECFIDKKIEAIASNILYRENKICKIRFSKKEGITSDSMYHELLHLELVTNGYSRMCIDNDLDNEKSITMLSDIFEHIMIEPKLESAGYSLNGELKAIEKTIKDIEKLKYKNSKIDIETFMIVFYTRSKLMRLNKNNLDRIRDFKIEQKENWYKENTKKIDKLLKNMPSPKMSIEEYKNCQEKCSNILNIKIKRI